MKKLIPIYLIIMICGIFFVNPQSINTSATTANNFIIRAYGDSISYGETLSDLSKAYPAVFSQKYVDELNAEFVAKGVSGDTTSDLLEDLQQYKDGTAYDLQNFNDTDIITLCIGANNVLGTALASLGDFLLGNLSEEEYQIMLDAGVAQFKLDYPKILKIFEGKQIIVMTVFNPYKYLTLNDINIDSSISANYEPMIRNILSTYEDKFQTMLSMSMVSLEQINNEIRNSSTDNITVIDIWKLFSTFTKQQYLNYINADISKCTITSTDILPLLQGNYNSLLTKIKTNCDPHPTEAGHAVIAQAHNYQFKLFEISLINTSSTILSLAVNSPVETNLTYKLYKKNNNGETLLLETKNKNFEINTSDLETGCMVYVEVYLNDRLIDTSNVIQIHLQASIALWICIGLTLCGIIIAIALIVFYSNNLKMMKKLGYYE